MCVCVRVHVWCVFVVYYTLGLAFNKRHENFNTHTHTYHYFLLLQCHSAHGHRLQCHRPGAVVDPKQCPLNLTGCPNAHGDVNHSSALTINTSGDGLCECTSDNSSERLCGGCSPSSNAVVSCAVLAKFTAAFVCANVCLYVLGCCCIICWYVCTLWHAIHTPKPTSALGLAVVST